MRQILALCLSLMLAPAFSAQAQGRAETLADIRQELSVLYVEVQRLKRELSTTGAPNLALGGTTTLERMNSIEEALERLTAQTEELEFRINRIVERGGNQIGDLEFRLCELEENCNIADLSGGTTLGDVELPDVAVIAPDDQDKGVELAVGEQAAFDRAAAALEAGDLETAIQQFSEFTETYPGGPLNARAHYLRGDALEQLGETRSAARAYLDSFSSAPDGPVAAEALLKVGTTLAALGQTTDACQMLEHVGQRFPGTEASAEAGVAMRDIGCS